MSFVLSFIVPTLVKLLLTAGLPALEAKFPGLTPLITAILQVLGGVAVPPQHEVAIQGAADHFNACTGVACPAELK